MPERSGGSGLSGRDLAALTEVVGGGLVAGPLVPAFAAAVLLARIDTPEAASLLDDLLAGRRLCVPALPVGGPASLDGDRGGLAFHDAREGALVLAWDAATERWVGLPVDGPGIALGRTVDGGSAGRIAVEAFAHDRVVALGRGPAGGEDAESAADVLALGTGGLLVGIARRALELSLEHLRTRRQFGAPLGSFQALQHRAATLHVQTTSARALLYEAAGCLGGPSGAAACAAARARAAETALAATREAVQFHGAVGFADEHEVGLLLRHAMALACSYGNAAAWRSRFLARSHGPA